MTDAFARFAAIPQVTLGVLAGLTTTLLIAAIDPASVQPNGVLPPTAYGAVMAAIAVVAIVLAFWMTPIPEDYR